MNGHRRLAVVATLAAGLALTVGTGGFSAVNADRGLSAPVADDSAAYLGIEIDVEDTGDADPRPAISYVGFCGEDGGDALEPTVAVTEYKSGEDPTEEALAVDWTTAARVSTVVLKTGGGPDALENVPGGTNGTAAVGAGTPAGDDQTTARENYCPDGEEPLGKVESDEFGVAGDATPVGGDDATATVTVTNRFPETTLDVQVEVGTATTTVTDLHPGESETLTVEVDCSRTVLADVDATGSGVAVDLEPRTVC